MSVTKTIKISEEQEKYLLSNHKNINQGVSNCIDKARFPDNSLDALKTIRAYSRKEITGKFNSAEWSFFADSLNGTMTDGMFRCNVEALVYHCQDAQELERMADKWRVDLPGLTVKIRTLTAAQVEAIYTYVEEFWESEGKDRNLEKWASALA